MQQIQLRLITYNWLAYRFVREYEKWYLGGENKIGTVMGRAQRKINGLS